MVGQLIKISEKSVKVKCELVTFLHEVYCVFKSIIYNILITVQQHKQF